jgi:tRNA(His) 5'-end guanylyltransferase
MKGDSLGDRMKTYYEGISKQFLYRRIPVIMRLDGKAFHTFTKGCNKPFDDTIIKTMQETTKYLMENIQGAKVGYVQSDEISILITDYDRLETDAWFGYNVQKMCSISASLASVKFTRLWMGEFDKVAKDAHFDSRVFNIPKEEVVNCFRWRFQDWRRNSIQMLAQSTFPQSFLQGRSCAELITHLDMEGKHWNDLSPVYRNGTLFYYADLEHRPLRMRSDIDLNCNDECNAIFGEYV